MYKYAFSSKIVNKTICNSEKARLNYYISLWLQPWGTPAVTWHYCKEFSFRISQSRLLLRKDQVKPNTRPVRRQACQTLLKALDISSATTIPVPDLLKDLAILSDTFVTISAVEQEDMKPYWRS